MRAQTSRSALERAVLERIKAHAISRIPAGMSQRLRLSTDWAVRDEGEQLGPKHQGIKLDRPSVVVCADPDPFANWGHPCRYLLYEAATGDLYAEKSARFPPFGDRIPPTYLPFHEPAPETPQYVAKSPSALGKRYAILFCGKPYQRHLDELELSFRMLIQIYNFDKQNIIVPYYDGTFALVNIPAVPSSQTWPGDCTDYWLRQQPLTEGSVQGFQDALSSIGGLLKSDDLLFIHVTGDGDSDESGSFVNVYQGTSTSSQYRAEDMARDLHKNIPHKHRALWVLLQQCSGGGFSEPIAKHSRAGLVSIVSAAKQGHPSYWCPCGWNYFSTAWVSAHTGWDVMNQAPVTVPGAGAGAGPIDADIAYNYADLVDVHPGHQDTPAQEDKPIAAGKITLA
jgi:hypothetical protein